MGLLDKAAVKQDTAAFNPDIVQPDLSGIRTIIEAYQKDHPSFQGIALKAAEGRNITQAASCMISHLGLACTLPGDNCLVLIPDNLDRELLAHRLSKSINAEILRQFSAASVDAALKAISPGVT